jgi:hypothetical protein
MSDVMTSDTTNPSTTSVPPAAAVATLATGLGVVTLLVGSGLIVPGIAAVVSGVFVAGLLRVVGRGTPWSLAVGCCCAVLAAITLVSALLFGIRHGSSVPESIVLAALPGAITLATAGGISTFTGSIGDRSATVAALLTAGVAAVLFLFAPILLVAAPDFSLIGYVLGVDPWTMLPVSEAIEYALGPAGFFAGVVSFAFVLLSTCVSVVVFLPRLPIKQLVSRSHEQAAVRRVDFAAHVGTRGAITAALIAVALPFVQATYSVSQIQSEAPVVATTIRLIVSSTPLRVILLAVTAILSVLFLLAWLFPWLARRRNGVTVRWLPSLLISAGIGGGIALGYRIVYTDRILPAIEALYENREFLQIPSVGLFRQSDLLMLLSPPVGSLVAVVLVAIAVLVLTTVLLLVAASGAIRLLPRRSTPGALTAASLIVGAILAALLDGSPVTVVITVFCAVFVWDSAAYGVSFTEELGRNAAEAIPILVHGFGSVVIGLFGVVVALVGYHTIVGVLTPAYAVTAAVSLVGVLLVSFILLRHRAPSSPPPSPNTDQDSSTEQESSSTTDTRSQPESQSQEETTTATKSASGRAATTGVNEAAVDSANEPDSEDPDTVTSSPVEEGTEMEHSPSSDQPEGMNPSKKVESEEAISEDIDSPDKGGANDKEDTVDKTSQADEDSSSIYTIVAVAFVFVGLLAFFSYGAVTGLPTDVILEGAVAFLLFAALIIAWLSR